MDAATVEHQALRLSGVERALLADKLLQTLGVEDAGRMERWGRVAEDRLQALERGESADTDGAAALAALRRRCG